jgi:predicted nucleotidyltransferase
MKSKEDKILELFFNTSKFWHFEELLEKAEISRPQLTVWLKQLQLKGIIIRVKHKGKMPYYVQDFKSPSFKIQKRLYFYQRLAESGFLEHLLSIKDIKTAILFGSFSRSDWYAQSDIDLFVYGNAEKLDIGKYEKIFNREIQLFICHDEKELKRMGAPLLRNVIQGNLIAGTITREMIENAAV